MKKIILFLILSLNFAGQSALDYLDSLPEDIRMQFENQLPDEGQTNVLTIEDNLTSNNLENNLEDMDENQEEEPFFGYNFFETNAETNNEFEITNILVYNFLYIFFLLESRGRRGNLLTSIYKSS